MDRITFQPMTKANYYRLFLAEILFDNAIPRVLSELRDSTDERVSHPHQTHGVSNMARFMRAARVALNIHPNEPSSIWKTWPYWVEF